MEAEARGTKRRLSQTSKETLLLEEDEEKGGGITTRPTPSSDRIKRTSETKRQRIEPEFEPASSSSSSINLSLDLSDNNGEEEVVEQKPIKPTRKRLKRKADVISEPSQEDDDDAMDISNEESDSDNDDEKSGSDSGDNSDDSDSDLDSFIVSDDDDDDAGDEDSESSSHESDASSAIEAKLTKKKKKRTLKRSENTANLDKLAEELADIMPWDVDGTAPSVSAKRLVSGETENDRLKARQSKVEKHSRSPNPSLSFQGSTKSKATTSASNNNSRGIIGLSKARQTRENMLREEWQEHVAELDRRRDKDARTAAQKDSRLDHQLKKLNNTPHNAIGMFSTETNRLYFHQLSGVAWMMLRETLPYKSVKGGALCDDMGVGKTTESLTLCAMDRVNGYHTVQTESRGVDSDMDFQPQTLVVCPNILLSTWEREWRLRFDPRLLSMLILHNAHTSDWQTKLSVSTMAETDILVINYEGLSIAYKELRNELLTDIRLHPSHYKTWLNEVDAHDPDEEDDGNDAILTEDDGTPLNDTNAINNSNGTNLSLNPEEHKKRAELDRKARRLVENNLQIGFRTIWKNPEKWKPKHFLYGWKFRRLMLDECTNVKNDATLRYASVHAIQADRRWGISGTPLENHIDELYSLLTILGMDRDAHSIRNKHHWHKVVANDPEKKAQQQQQQTSNGSALLVPDAEVVARLRRRFLNVTTLRREIQNINAVNPMAPYVKRALCQPHESNAWDMFVSTRTAAKRERAIQRHHRSQSRRSMNAAIRLGLDSGDAWWSQPLAQLTRQQLTRAFEASDRDPTPTQLEQQRLAISVVRPSIPSAKGNKDGSVASAFLQGVPEGFYWYTTQKHFQAAYQRVDMWIQEVFNISLVTINEANEAARTYMRTNTIAVPSTKEHEKGIREAILGVIQRDSLDSLPPVNVLGNFPVPTPLLFVAECHELERAVYTDGLSIARQLVGATTASGLEGSAPRISASESQSNQNVAFRCITQCRTACLDYRSARNAPAFLTEKRGILWDIDNAEPIELFNTSEIVDEASALAAETALFGATTASVASDTPDELADKEILIFNALEHPKTTATTAASTSKPSSRKKGAGSESVQRTIEMPQRVPTKYLMYLRYIQALPPGTKFIIFSEYVSYLPRLRRFFEANGVKTVTIVGGMNIKVRDEHLERFRQTNADAPRLLLASLRCANMGINLQCASQVLMNPSWNGAVEEQAKRRVLRMGQDKDVFFVYFVLLNTIEELVLSRGGEKSDMITSVVGTDDGLIKTGSNFTRPDIDNAYIMKFDQSDYGPVTPHSAQERLWNERSLDDLKKLPTMRLGSNFARVTTASLLSDKGKFDHTKVARALCNSNITV